MEQFSFKNEQIIFSTVEDAFAVWFKAPHKFILMEEPAFFVFKELIGNGISDNLISECVIRYQRPFAECRQFVDEINKELWKFLPDQLIENDFPIAPEQFHEIPHAYFSEKIYSLGNLIIKISFNDFSLEDIIHPIISHSETFVEETPIYEFTICKDEDDIFLKLNGKIEGKFKSDEAGFLKAAFLLKLQGILFNIENDQWMMTVHASATTDGEKAIVFPAEAGGGKSTLAALLQSHGFRIISDDFIAIDRQSKMVFDVPVAITIKEGSIDVLSPFYPDLLKTSSQIAYTGKDVRFFYPFQADRKLRGYPVKYVVFVKYSESGVCSLKALSLKEALVTFLSQTWVYPDENNIKEFFNWFNLMSFYQLEYSNTSEAIEMIHKLFDSE